MSFINTMKTYSLDLFEWFKAYGHLVGIFSVASFVGSILFCTLAITYLPTDYFLPKRREFRIKNLVLRVCLICLKNVLAAFLIVVGFIQIPLPGQGVLTMLIGIVISDIPGKRKLERKIIRLPAILSATNRIRARFGRPPIVLDGSAE